MMNVLPKSKSTWMPTFAGMTRKKNAVRARFAALALFALAAGCSFAPPPLYVPMSAGSYGYAEQQTGDISYRITYRAPVFSTFSYGRATRDRIANERVALAYDMALLRAADIALARGMPAFREIRRDNDVQVDVQDDPLDDYYYNRPCFDFHFCTPPPYVSRDRRSIFRIAATIDVRLETRIEAGAYDAADAKRKLLAAHPDALPRGGTGQ
jgi:hypothetical protein